jgi:hypothetical protein
MISAVLGPKRRFVLNFSGHEMSGQNDTDRLVIAVENVFRQIPSWLVVGDLFLTLRGLHYVPLGKVRRLGNLEGLLGAMIGGWQGGIAAALGANQKVRACIAEVSQIRIEQYGLSIQERMSYVSLNEYSCVEHCNIDLEKYCLERQKETTEQAVSIAKDNITSLEITKDLTGLVCRTIDGKVTEFGFSELNDQAGQTFRGYLQVAFPTVDESATYGLDNLYPAPVRLIERLKQGQSIESRTWRGIVGNAKYMDILYLLLKKQDKRRRINMCRMIVHMDSRAGKLLSELARNDIIRQQKADWLPLGISAFFAVFCIFACKSFLSTGEIAWFIGSAVGTMLFIGCCIAIPLTSATEPKTILRNL